MSTGTAATPTDTPTAAPRRPAARQFSPLAGAVAGIGLVVFLIFLPYMQITIPGVFPGPSGSAGTMQLLGFAMLIGALALSYHLLFGVAGMLSFGHALFFAAGAYGLAICMNRIAPAWLPGPLVFIGAIVLTLIFGLILAGAVGAASLRVSGITFAMVTLAFSQVGSDVLERNPSGITGGDEGLSLPAAHTPALLVGVDNTVYLYWICLGVLVFVYLATRLFEASRGGHVAAGVRENETRIRALGMSPYWARFAVFAVAAFIAILCGIVYTLLESGATPSIASSDFTLELLVIVVLGGVGSRWGAIAGGVIYTLLDQRLSALAGSSTVAGLPGVLRVPLSQPVFILGVIFILVVVFLPGGLSGVTRRRGERRRRSGTLDGEPDERTAW